MGQVAAIAALLLAAGCATGAGAPARDSTTYIVKSDNGDRVSVEVEGSVARGFKYRAILHAARRADLDAAARRAILNDAMRSTMLIGCGCSNPYKPGVVGYASNDAEQVGRFSCAGF